MTAQHSTAHYITAQHNALQCSAWHCSTAQHTTERRSAAANWAALLPGTRTCAHALTHQWHTAGKRCDGGGIKFANSCDVIKQHFPCKMCWKSQGSDQPCYVSMMNAPPEKHPGDCMIEGTHTTHACNTAHTAQHSTAHTLCTHSMHTTPAPPTPHYTTHHPRHTTHTQHTLSLSLLQ
jgi:hypothetical protein